MTVMAKDPRSPVQIREHYEIEKELALRLRTASYTQRQGLYSQVYDELFRRVPHHMQLTVGASEARAAARMEEAEYELYGLEPYLKPHTIFAEIGAGDCAITMAVAARVKHAYAIDVSTEVTKGLSPPDNFTLLISDGRNIPVTPGTIHVAFSTQLMEHLHPEDAGEQLSSIYRSLAPGGTSTCAVSPS